jgi:peptidyl-prolyl cis-trans isomerase SDCCAG10
MAEIQKMEAEVRKLSRRNNSDDDMPQNKKKKSYLEEELARYSKGRGLNKKWKDGKKKDEGDVLAALNSFRSKLKGSRVDMMDVEVAEGGEGEGGSAEKVPGEEDAGIEVDDDRGFMNHTLHFPKDDGEESRKAERDYEVIDPRQRGAKAKEEERERKRVKKAARGGRRY